MKKMRLLLLVLLGSAVLGSCHKDNKSTYLLNNQNFVTQASSANSFEVAAGQLAVSKSTNDSVKMFGNHMITDHSKAATEMASLAQRKGWRIPDTLMLKDRNNLDTLNALTGVAFDRKFADVMVVSHQQTIQLFQAAAGSLGVPDADLRNFAAGKLPNLQLHLNDAIALTTYVNK